MEATHHGFNVLKILGANGMITLCCNEKDALRSVEHVYREAAAMFPADEDLLEHSSDLTRKKQLVSQERAPAKKASLEPLLPGSTGKKFATSASTRSDRGQLKEKKKSCGIDSCRQIGSLQVKK
jgi:hypothetical protein